MTVLLGSLVVGQLYSNEEIFRSLGVGNAGGVRVKAGTQGQIRRGALFTSIPTPRQLAENPYVDRLEGTVLIYTGSGREGDQSLTGGNAKLQQQLEARFPIYGFTQIANRRSPSGDNRRWQFLGLLDLLRSYRETQVDSLGKPRAVWVFEMFVHERPSEVVVESDVEAAELARRLDDVELRPSDREVPHASDGQGLSNQNRDIAVLEPIRKRLLTLDPRAFEYFVRDLLQHSGFDGVEVTRYSQDGGIDVNARPAPASWPIRQLLVQVQAKRWLHTVGRKEVAELRGSMQPHAAGCIVTTSQFSRATIQEAGEFGKVPITVINGLELAEWTLQVGVTLD